MHSSGLAFVIPTISARLGLSHMGRLKQESSADASEPFGSFAGASVPLERLEPFGILSNKSILDASQIFWKTKRNWSTVKLRGKIVLKSTQFWIQNNQSESTKARSFRCWANQNNLFGHVTIFENNEFSQYSLKVKIRILDTFDFQKLFCNESKRIWVKNLRIPDSKCGKYFAHFCGLGLFFSMNWFDRFDNVLTFLF